MGIVAAVGLLVVISVAPLSGVDYAGTYMERGRVGHANPAADPPWTVVTIIDQADGTYVVEIERRQFGHPQSELLARSVWTGGRVVGPDLLVRDVFGDQHAFHFAAEDPDTLHFGTQAQRRDTEAANRVMGQAGLFMAIGSRWVWRRVRTQVDQHEQERG